MSAKSIQDNHKYSVKLSLILGRRLQRQNEVLDTLLVFLRKLAETDVLALCRHCRVKDPEAADTAKPVWRRDLLDGQCSLRR